MLETRDLRFGYIREVEVVRGISLQLPRASLCAVIGANGCGKSTLIRLVAGALVPQSGEILLEGTPLTRLPAGAAARRLAYVPQSSRMAFPFTVMEVVMTGRTPYTPRFRFEGREDIARARAALETAGALHLAARRITEVSGGELQMVALARALAQEPACLLLDEPAAALDLKHRAALIRTLAKLRDEHGLAALVVTHDLNLVDPAFDIVVALRCGEVVARGTPAQVLERDTLAAVYDDPYVRTQRIGERTVVWSE